MSDGPILINANEVLMRSGFRGKVGEIGVGFGTGRYTATRRQDNYNSVVSSTKIQPVSPPLDKSASPKRQKITFKEGGVQTDDNQTDWNTYEPQPSTLIKVPILEFNLLVQPSVESRPPKFPPRPTRLVDWQQSKLFQNITCN